MLFVLKQQQDTLYRLSVNTVWGWILTQWMWLVALYGCKWNANFSYRLFCLFLSPLNECFCKVEAEWIAAYCANLWRKLPGVEADLTTILVYIPVETAAVLTLVRMAMQQNLLCMCACVFVVKMLQAEGMGCGTCSRQKLSHLEKKTK